MKKFFLRKIYLFIPAIWLISQPATAQTGSKTSLPDTVLTVSSPDSSFTHTDSTKKTVEMVEEDAYFPGGDNAWIRFLSTNINSMVPVKKGAPAGTYTVIVRFIVTKDGSVADIQPLTDYGYGMEAEAMRVIAKSPKWVPAVQNKRKVNAYRQQPLTFVVEEKTRKKKG